jgi:hypothetical protein
MFLIMLVMGETEATTSSFSVVWGEVLIASTLNSEAWVVDKNIGAGLAIMLPSLRWVIEETNTALGDSFPLAVEKDAAPELTKISAIIITTASA